MGAVEYKMFFDGESATEEQLARIDEIKVDQAVDKACEARIKIPVCVNNDGKWEGEEEAWMKAFTTIRIEVNPGDGKFVPLVDGPVVGFDSERTAQPGKSLVTVIVHDASALLNRKAKVEVKEGQIDSDLAKQIYTDAGIKEFQIDPTPPQPDPITSAAVQRGTPMQYLRELARRNQEWHAYVLPGKVKGQSIGCFRKFPQELDTLPEMVLLGLDRNIESFNVNNKAQQPCTMQAATLTIAHDKVQTSKASYRDKTLLADQPPDAANTDEAECLVPPGISDRLSLADVTAGAASNSGFSLEATGAVVPFCYKAALSPYRWVLVRISDSKFSTKYLITQVTHTLTRSVYTQSFSMKSDGVTVATGGAATGPQPSANASVSFNVQVSIF